MALEHLRKKLEISTLSPAFGTITKVMSNSIVATGLKPSVGDIVKIVRHEDGVESMGMVTVVDTQTFSVSPFSFVEGNRVGDRIFINNKGLQIPVGEALLGRVINPLGQPIDGKGEILATQSAPIIRPPIVAMKRGMIDEVFSVGVKTIDGLLTCGKGQKLGIFAGSGVGKSTLMGMIVKGVDAPIKIVALVGERGREVPEFVEKNLGGDLSGTVLVVATSDDSPLMRKYGAFSAMSVAEYFKDQGHD
ncbi:MAG: EscN/YscN/HrcN family type III secretion system ATPase, partial [Helicobacter sp.]|nr:EscN/YscN/HrcN family type III secretion system ATPase [Helicobacter sp.]